MNDVQEEGNESEKDENGNRDKMIRVRVNAGELAALDECRKRLGYRTKSAMIRALPAIALKRQQRFRPVKFDKRALLLKKEVQRLRGELAAQGRNLNMITREFLRGNDREPLYYAALRIEDELKRIGDAIDGIEGKVAEDGD